MKVKKRWENHSSVANRERTLTSGKGMDSSSFPLPFCRTKNAPEKLPPEGYYASQSSCWFLPFALPLSTNAPLLLSVSIVRDLLLFPHVHSRPSLSAPFAFHRGSHIRPATASLGRRDQGLSHGSRKAKFPELFSSSGHGIFIITSIFGAVSGASGLESNAIALKQ